MRGRRLLASLAALSLLAAACGDDDDADEAATETTAAAAETTAAAAETTAAAGGDETTTSAEGESSGEPLVVRVGVPLDMTGPAAIAGIGTNEFNAMKLALSEVEESDFLGDISIELVEVDTKADKQEAVAGVLKLIEEEDVDAIVGFTLTPSFMAAAPQAVEAGIPVIAAGLAAPGVTAIGDKVFRIIPNVTGLYAVSDKQFAEAYDVKTAAYLYASDSETTVAIHGARKAALEEVGVTTLIEQTAGASDSDYRAQLTEIDKAGADVIVITAFPGQFAPIFLQAEELGIDTMVFSSDGTGRNEVLEQAGSAMQCVVYNAVWAAQNETGRNPHFIEAVRSELDDEADLYYAAGYDAMWVFATALRDAGSADADAIVTALNDLEDFEGAFGVYGFNDDREPELSGTNLQVIDSEVVLWSPDSDCER